MDAKQAIELLKREGVGMSYKAGEQIASLLESQSRDAELGRANK